MTPRYHPADERLLEHAAGSLTACPDLVIATHLRACPECRAKVALGEALGGALLTALPPAVMSADALERALARIERPEPAVVTARTVAPLTDWIEAPASVIEAARRRRRWAAPGVWVAPVGKGPGRSRSYLLRVAPGMSVPHHTHRGREMVCVLKGAYLDRGVVYGPGDFSENDEDVAHTPTVTGDGECVCLISADAPLSPLNWVGRLFQPIVRI